MAKTGRLTEQLSFFLTIGCWQVAAGCWLAISSPRATWVNGRN
jgi:hypothetical protein